MRRADGGPGDASACDLRFACKLYVRLDSLSLTFTVERKA